ncbi:sensor histidine kinase [Paenibacillus thalictri]|uniref:HAMP domain-containing protein n=1 Tax=Paenibacillus thalictri TaxID=2527873 RepID=A0A4Q9DQ45_9BACL|nr:histidine kinase [Paenibacillus thalictri]TBL76371.1 hypothetical protein EYB31_20505 [Paenibacillus thalictri]
MYQAILRHFIPQTLKTRLFAVFMLFIFIPFSLLNIRNYNRIESSLETQLGYQCSSQLGQIRSEIEELKGLVFKAAIRLSQENELKEAIRLGEASDGSTPQGEKLLLSRQINGILPVFEPYSNLFQFTIADLDSVHYSTAQADISASTEALAQDLVNRHKAYIWTHSEGANMKLTLTLLVKEGDPAAGIIRVDFDYIGWLKARVSYFPIQQHLFIMDEAEHVLSGTSPGMSPPPSDVINQLREMSPRPEYTIDNKTRNLITVASIPSMNWYLVGSVPLEVFFGDLPKVKIEYFISFLILACLFIFITFLTVSTLTRPLLLMQRKMSELVQKKLFHSRLAEDRFSGEMLGLAKTFNRMTADLERLIEQMRIEERQKEALRFQMLMSQMNPHFLLNTLNAIKWNAYQHQDQATYEMCKSLGVLLETGLNTDLELLHLKDEIHLVKAFAYIQNFRFNGRFQIAYEYDDSLQYGLIPKLSLQPLVENAIHHAFHEEQEDCRIIVRAVSLGNKLVLEVEDNGTGVSITRAETPDSRRKRGIGLYNLRERLKLLFRGEASFELIQTAGKGTLARIRMPLLISQPYEQGE